MLLWNWIALGVLATLVLYLQFRLHRIRQKSVQREELFKIVTENAADMIALVDVKGHRLYNSPAYKRILGYSTEELAGTSSFEQIHPDDRFKVLEAAREARSSGVGRRMEYRVRHKDGTWRILESMASAIWNEKGEVSKLVIVNRDVTERKRAEEQLEHNSFHDALTGLANRRLFLDRLQHNFARAQRNAEHQYSVLFVDLDSFKVFNDTMSPSVGDEVIIEVGQRLAACLRDHDTISRPQDNVQFNTAVLSRIGGDEFTILLEGVSDPSDAMRAANRIRAAVAQPFVVGGLEVRASASVGIALGSRMHERAEDLLQDAETAMRRAKAMGGGRCELFDAAMHTRATNQLKLEAQLHDALVQRQFRVYYQPIVMLETKQIVGFEALLRWQHPEQGLISPNKFIEAAEDAGLLVSTGQWVINEACQQMRKWKIDLPVMAALSLNVNVSAKQFASSGFVSALEATLRQSGIEPGLLRVEITENVATTDSKRTAGVLSQLKQLRVGIILDDFGSGNSSLKALPQFPIEALKIDRELVGTLLLERSALETIELILLLANKLKLKVIAEGIESAKQLDHLLALGCEFGQGYLFSRPLEAKAAEMLIREDYRLQSRAAPAK